ncbi:MULTISPECIES: hypothetical protein [Rhizobium/Agrobacterium group]|uniref:Uncharacterized protein n=1 Tax=Allorhizobium ampelinum (strain ATCC BAA-846 / DSM 112012 / S4) TaxID=311402 RepID=B9K2R3_ALLAM|nr:MULTISPECIES: hypothetical protein [Rhizobium/Agrobacterium group]ACM39161.1 hypothetical protein Avi_6168 [Allorhizobium ampelinum S4]MUO30804.1 hypothetical protein [Agrobacterium vitis]
MRALSEQNIGDLKGATEASYVLGGGVTSFAVLTRVGVSTLSKYAGLGPENAQSLIPIDIAVEADKRARQPIILAEMARQLGYRLVPDDGSTNETSLCEHDALMLSLGAAKLAGVVADATADNRIDAREREDIIRAGLPLVRQVEEILLKARG